MNNISHFNEIGDTAIKNHIGDIDGGYGPMDTRALAAKPGREGGKSLLNTDNYAWIAIVSEKSVNMRRESAVG